MDNQQSQAQTISSLPGAMAIFGQAWAIYKKRFGTFLGIAIAPIIILIISSVVLIGGGFLGADLFSSKFAAGGTFLLIFLAILFFVIIFIGEAWGLSALLYAIKDREEGIDIIESYRRGWHKIFSYWWVWFLKCFIILGGYFLLIIPGIIFAIWFSLAEFILIAEDIKGMNALLKSREYVKGKWGRVFWYFFFIGIMSAAALLMISVVLIPLFSFLKIPLAGEITNVITGLFFVPMVMIYWFLVYNHIRTLKGEVIVSPARGKKAAFIFVGILGIIILSLSVFLELLFFQRIVFSLWYGKYKKKNTWNVIREGSRILKAFNQD